MSTLVIDTIQGKTTAGSVNVRGEGSNNTNLQQGLCKVWCRWAGTSTPSDSFNVSSITDISTRNLNVKFTNSFQNANYSYVGSVQNNVGVAAGVIILLIQATGSFRTATEETNDFGVYDAAINCTQGNGDLA